MYSIGQPFQSLWPFYNFVVLHDAHWHEEPHLHEVPQHEAGFFVLGAAAEGVDPQEFWPHMIQ